MGENILSKLQQSVSNKFEEIKMRKMKQMVSEFVLPIVEPKINDFFDLIDQLQQGGKRYYLKVSYEDDHLILQIFLSGTEESIINVSIERSELITFALDENKTKEITNKLKTIIQ